MENLLLCWLYHYTSSTQCAHTGIVIIMKHSTWRDYNNQMFCLLHFLRALNTSFFKIQRFLSTNGRPLGVGRVWTVLFVHGRVNNLWTTKCCHLKRERGGVIINPIKAINKDLLWDQTTLWKVVLLNFVHFIILTWVRPPKPSPCPCEGENRHFYSTYSLMWLPHAGHSLLFEFMLQLAKLY